MALAPGLLMADRYQLGHRIAVGGMGEVWEATDQRLGRSVAVKILKSEFTSDPEFVDRFRTEARITAALNNPGIAAVYDYGETETYRGGPKDTAFLVMELVVGEPLSAVLARSPRLPINRTLDMLEQSGRALQEAHARGLVHRDIKPGNILITPAGKVKITDFGIAKVAHQAPLTRQGMVMGTAQYLAPEQASGGEAVAASDVYALGIVGYECLAGRRPFTGDNQMVIAMAQIRNEPPPLPADVPAPIAQLIMQALVKDPAARFPNGAAFADAVSVIRKGGVVPVPAGVRGVRPPAAARPMPTGATTVYPGPPPISAPINNPRPAVRPVAQAAAGPNTGSRTGVSVAIALLVLIVAAAMVISTFFDLGGPLNIGLGSLTVVGLRPLRTAATVPIVALTESERDLGLQESSRPVPTGRGSAMRSSFQQLRRTPRQVPVEIPVPAFRSTTQISMMQKYSQGRGHQ